MLRLRAIGIAATLLFFPLANGQGIDDPALLAQLKQLFPDAATFAPKSGNPPHFKALAAGSSKETPRSM